jgi:hypothetical protein
MAMSVRRLTREEKAMKNILFLMVLAVGSVPMTFAQATGESGTAGTSRDSVTTNDSVYNPNDGSKKGANDANNGKLPKDKGPKNNTKPVSPPNAPVVDPHEDPSSPVNTPTTGSPSAAK